MVKNMKHTLTLNKACNIAIIILIVLILTMTMIHLLTPLFYDGNSKVKESTYDKYIVSQVVVEKYINSMKANDQKAIKKMLPIVRQKSQKTYEAYSKYLQENNVGINIKQVEMIDEKNHLITYTMIEGTDEKIVVHFNENQQTFQIYYDQKLQSF